MNRRIQWPAYGVACCHRSSSFQCTYLEDLDDALRSRIEQDMKVALEQRFPALWCGKAVMVM